MAKPRPMPPKHTRFKKGQSGNPGGKPRGTRNTLTAEFLKALSKEFHINGRKAIYQCRRKDPVAFVKVLAALLPKELEIKRPLDEMTDEQLANAIATLQAIVAAQGDAAGGGAPQVDPTTH